SVPAVQIERLPKALPVWYAFQHAAFRFLPRNEFGFRMPSLLCAILISAGAVPLAARWRGVWFACALALRGAFGQAFGYLSQVDRFYSMPLLLLLLTFATIAIPRGGMTMIVVAAMLAALSVLSHNIIVPVFVLAFLAACVAYVFGRVSTQVVLRSGAAAL